MHLNFLKIKVYISPPFVTDRIGGRSGRLMEGNKEALGSCWPMLDSDLCVCRF